MPIRTEQFITRQMMRNEPDTLFVFGDNMRGTGRGGQAAVMRGEPNAVGIPTKWIPSMTDASFFSDADFDVVSQKIEVGFETLRQHLRKGGNVVWPADGIGTGRALLQTKSPRIWLLIETLRKHLEETYQ